MAKTTIQPQVPMTLAAAIALCSTLRRLRRGGAVVLKAEATSTRVTRARIVNGKAKFVVEDEVVVTFSGGLHGAHCLTDSSEERVLAHWAGYCEANSRFAPTVGQTVDFPSGSSHTGRRLGRVAKLGTKRAVIEFTYKHGGKSTATVAFSEIGIGT